MNTRILAAALTLSLASASSLAADLAWRATQDEESPSTLTRTEVRADLVRAQGAARFDGTRIAYAIPGAASEVSSSGLTRAQVRAELARARANGELEIGVKAYGAKPVVDGVPASGIASTARPASSN